MFASSINQQPEIFNILSVLDNKTMGERSFSYPTRSFQKNEYIYLPNKKTENVFIVKEGRVKIGSQSEGDKEVIKKVAIKGEIFGEFPLVGETTHNDYSLAMEDTVVFVLTSSELESLMRDHKALSIYIMQILADRLIEMESRLESLVFKTSRSRIVEFLENLVTKRGQRVGYEMLVRKFFTHQEIANLTATSRQTVTTVLNDLRKKNILTFNRRRLLIRDMELLRAEAA